MIKVTRKKGNEVLINQDQIKSIETTDITTIIFMSGYRIEAKESETRILQYIRAFESGKNNFPQSRK